MIGEEFPRGCNRAIAILTSLATVGVMLMATQPYVLLPERGGQLATARTRCCRAPSALGRDARELARALRARARPAGDRALAAARHARDARFGRLGSGAVSPAQRARVARGALAPQYRRRSAIVALLWNCVFIVTGPSTVYWVIFAREQLHLTTHQVGDIVFWGYGGGVTGHFVAGWLIDRSAQRTCATYVSGAV
jgi:hypothetical protein